MVPNADAQRCAKRMRPFFQGGRVEAFGNEGDQAQHFRRDAGDNAARLRWLAGADAVGSVAKGIASITGSGATASPGVIGWWNDELSATQVAQAEAAGVLVQQHSSFALGVGGL